MILFLLEMTAKPQCYYYTPLSDFHYSTMITKIVIIFPPYYCNTNIYMCKLTTIYIMIQGRTKRNRRWYFNHPDFQLIQMIIFICQCTIHLLLRSLKILKIHFYMQFLILCICVFMCVYVLYVYMYVFIYLFI